jgi:hypothetical protein
MAAFVVRSNGSQKSRLAENYVAQSAMYSGLRHEDRRNAKIHHPGARRRQATMDNFTRNQAWRMKVAILKFPRGYCWGYSK